MGPGEMTVASTAKAESKRVGELWLVNGRTEKRVRRRGECACAAAPCEHLINTWELEGWASRERSIGSSDRGGRKPSNHANILTVGALGNVLLKSLFERLARFEVRRRWAGRREDRFARARKDVIIVKVRQAERGIEGRAREGAVRTVRGATVGAVRAACLGCGGFRG